MAMTRSAARDRAATYYSGLGRLDPQQTGPRGAPGRPRRAQHRDLLDRHGASRGSPAWCARSSPRASSGRARLYSAFTIAFQVPNLVANLFANAALSAAFVPVFTELLQEGGAREALRLASTVFWIMLIALGAITAVIHPRRRTS